MKTVKFQKMYPGVDPGFQIRGAHSQIFQSEAKNFILFFFGGGEGVIFGIFFVSRCNIVIFCNLW